MSETWASAPLISRRTALFGGSVLLLTASSFLPASAAGENLLDRLRRQKVVKVGIANAPPFSAMRPDGSMTGVGPTMARRVLERLGIPQMEGAIATYGELIPGMMAGRWDFIAAAMLLAAIDGDCVSKSAFRRSLRYAMALRSGKSKSIAQGSGI